MGPEIGKYALIINGDTESRHLDNVERAIQILEAQGYETFAASREKPKAPADHFVPATYENIEQLIGEIKQKSGTADDLFIYTTGHGDKENGEGSLCIGEKCDSKSMAALLDGIRYGQRTVVMDQCFGGDWAKIFVDDPKTLFVSAGSPSEEVCCQKFSPQFFALDVPDENRDGVVNWEERYAYTLAGDVIDSTPQFISSAGYVQMGAPPFGAQVVEISEEVKLKGALQSLKPGQYAIVTFSASWCGPCQGYKPIFEEMAKKDGGQHLWLHTENQALAAKYGVEAVPTVMIFDSKGEHKEVKEKEKVLEELAQFYLFVDPKKFKAMLSLTIATEEKMGITSEESIRRLQAFARQFPTEMKSIREEVVKGEVRLARSTLTLHSRWWAVKIILSSGLEIKPETVSIWDSIFGLLYTLIPIMGKEPDDYQSRLLLNSVFSSFAEAGLKQRAVAYLNRLLLETKKIKEVPARASLSAYWAYQYRLMGEEKKADALFDEVARLADGIQDTKLRGDTKEYILELIFLSALK